MNTDSQWMQLLSDTSLELASILDLDRLLQRAGESIRRFIDYDLFAVLLIDPTRKAFVCKAASGFSTESLKDLQGLNTDEGLVGRAVRTRSPVLVEDVDQESDYRPIRAGNGQSPSSELVVPLIFKDSVVGVLVLWSFRAGFFSEWDLYRLKPLAAQIAVSIENASLYEEKSRDVLTRRVLYEVGKDMTAILEFDELLSRMAVLIRRVIEYEILGVFLYNRARDVMELKVAIGYADETIQRWRDLPVGRGLLGHAALARKTIVSPDLASDPRAISAKTADGRWTRSEVAIPLISRHRLLGGLVVESCEPHYFDDERVEILDTLARQMAVAIDNAALFEELLAKEQKLKADFAMARDLQTSMLPVGMPQVAGLSFASLYRPAESLGGDYYDFLWLDEQHLGIAVGDVSGKGVAAAMTMVAARSALRFAARLNTAPSQVMYHINRRLFRDLKQRNYVSLFYAVLEVNSQSCRWSNAGHLPPILLHADGSMEELSKGGLPIAMFDRARYDSGKIRLRAGDLLLLYTDGVSEAEDPSGEEFGKDRLVSALTKTAGQSAKEVLRAVNKDLRKFRRGRPQRDDVTLLVIKAEA